MERFASVLGTLLLGASTGLVLLRRREKRRSSAPPVTELAKTLKEAWAPYHTR